MKGMTTCKVCGRDFPLLAEEHYVAEDPQKVGALANLVNTDRALEYDAFDCPHCGCQNVMQVRKSAYISIEECPCDLEDYRETEDVTPKNHDGCMGCRYQDREEDEDPCVRCRYRYVDRWEADDDE